MAIYKDLLRQTNNLEQAKFKNGNLVTQFSSADFKFTQFQFILFYFTQGNINATCHKLLLLFKSCFLRKREEPVIGKSRNLLSYLRRLLREVNAYFISMIDAN